MNKPDYTNVLEEISKLIQGDVSASEVDREKFARDTSLFYVKPEIIVSPKDVKDISKVLAYVLAEKKKGKISQRARLAQTLKKLHGYEPNTWRYRIGKYRTLRNDFDFALDFFAAGSDIVQ